jgi:hypothetical protein
MRLGELVNELVLLLPIPPLLLIPPLLIPLLVPPPLL